MESTEKVIDGSPAVGDVAPKENGRQLLLTDEELGAIPGVIYRSSGSFELDPTHFASFQLTTTDYTPDNEGLEKACDVAAQITMTTEFDTEEVTWLHYTATEPATTFAGTLNFQYKGFSLDFTKNENPSGKAKINAHLNSKKVDKRDIKMIAEIVTDKAMKLEMIQAVDDVGLLDKCPEAANLLHEAAAAYLVGSANAQDLVN